MKFMELTAMDGKRLLVNRELVQEVEERWSEDSGDYCCVDGFPVKETYQTVKVYLEQP